MSVSAKLTFPRSNPSARDHPRDSGKHTGFGPPWPFFRLSHSLERVTDYKSAFIPRSGSKTTRSGHTTTTYTHPSDEDLVESVRNLPCWPGTEGLPRKIACFSLQPHKQQLPRCRRGNRMARGLRPRGLHPNPHSKQTGSVLYPGKAPHVRRWSFRHFPAL